MTLDAKLKAKLKVHSKHHSAKHMAVMNAMLKSGKTFNQAHRAALKVDKKKV